MTADIRRTGLIAGLGRSPGGGDGNPLPYSCLENPKNRGAWWATVYRVTKSRRSKTAYNTHTWTGIWLLPDIRVREMDCQAECKVKGMWYFGFACAPRMDLNEIFTSVYCEPLVGQLREGACLELFDFFQRRLPTWPVGHHKTQFTWKGWWENQRLKVTHLPEKQNISRSTELHLECPSRRHFKTPWQVHMRERSVFLTILQSQKVYFNNTSEIRNFCSILSCFFFLFSFFIFYL